MLLLPLLPIKFISLNMDEKSLSKICLPSQNQQSVNNKINKVVCAIVTRLEILNILLFLNQFVRFSLNKSYCQATVVLILCPFVHLNKNLRLKGETNPGIN